MARFILCHVKRCFLPLTPALSLPPFGIPTVISFVKVEGDSGERRKVRGI
jgi:hypothetical protein